MQDSCCRLVAETDRFSLLMPHIFSSIVRTRKLVILSTIIKQVPWNKSSLLLKNILQNTQTLQLFTMGNKIVIKNAKLGGLGDGTKRSN